MSRILSPKSQRDIQLMAVESGLHTNAETGNSYRTFAICKREAVRSRYIHNDELTEAYTAVTLAKLAIGGSKPEGRALP